MKLHRRIESAETERRQRGGSRPVEESKRAIHSYRGDKRERKLGAEDFVAHALLGSGAFGEVYLVEELATGAPFAMKVLKKKSLSRSECKSR